MPLVHAAGSGSGYGCDFVQTATGDFAVLVDEPGNPAASQQLLTRIIMTNPLVKNAQGRAIGRPDDLVYTGFGAGVRFYQGQPQSTATASAIQNAVLASIAASKFFASSPAPTCVVQTDGNNDNLLFITTTACNVTGDLVSVTTSLQ